jgi:hypothetical protein
LIQRIIFHRTLTAKFIFEDCLQRVKLKLQNEKICCCVCESYLSAKNFLEVVVLACKTQPFLHLGIQLRQSFSFDKEAGKGRDLFEHMML